MDMLTLIIDMYILRLKNIKITENYLIKIKKQKQPDHGLKYLKIKKTLNIVFDGNHRKIKGHTGNLLGERVDQDGI
jgi:hypothetical protein